MTEGHASRTAEYMALFRALESARPADRRLFSDPFARRFLGAPLALVARAARLPPLGDLVCSIIDRRWPGARTSAVARTRFIDDVVVDEARGVSQLVILGAGFDARAYRLQALRRAAVFEVDHPDTSRAKRAAVARVLGDVPAHVSFVPTDFDERALPQAMAAAGHRPEARSLVLWEGVTNYLTAPAVDATLRWCAQAAPGSRLVFTYDDRAVLDDPTSFVGTERLRASLATAGERWTFGLDPGEVPAFLAARGLALEQDVGATEYRRRCFGPAAARMAGYEFYRIVVARVR